jgi:hypothetical protein
MSRNYLSGLAEDRRQAVAELIEIIARHYPTASFAVHPGEDDPTATHITATVDADDPDEVLELVLERELALQLEQGIPVYVIPIRTPERTAALLDRHARESRGFPSPAHVATTAAPGEAADTFEYRPVAPDLTDPRIQAALAELRETILRHFPEATFSVTLGEDPVGIYLNPVVDVEDLDEVADVFTDRLVDMQVEEGLPIYVIPLPPPERVRAQWRARAS